MTDKSDSAGSAPQVTQSSSAAGASKSGTAATSSPDGQYLKAVRKGHIKEEPRLAPSKYLSRVEDMQWVLEVRRLWAHVGARLPKPDKTTRPNNHEEWSFDDANTEMWIRANLDIFRTKGP